MVSYGDALIIPGLVDIHIHFPQITTVASYGEQLLEWLQDYIFPGEAEYDDAALAQARAAVFLKELLRRGTTTAAVYGSLAQESVDGPVYRGGALEPATGGRQGHDGPKWSGRHATDHARVDYQNSMELIEKWHGKGRLSYVVTPRFAPACSAADLQVASRLLKEHPGVYVQTHLCENLHEIAWVRELFPERRVIWMFMITMAWWGKKRCWGMPCTWTMQILSGSRKPGRFCVPVPLPTSSWAAVCSSLTRPKNIR